jgi:hypothetical protein
MPPAAVYTLLEACKGCAVAACSSAGMCVTEDMPADVQGKEEALWCWEGALRGFFGLLLGNLVVPSAVPDSSLMQFQSLSAASDSVACTQSLPVFTKRSVDT